MYVLAFPLEHFVPAEPPGHTPAGKAVACDVYDGVFLRCPFPHEVSWMRS